jgi:phosphoribosylformylglycinamidine synthase
VSLYNESKATGGGSAILPTPAIGGVGLLDDWEKSATIGFKAKGEGVFLIGGNGDGHLGQSLWLREIHGISDGPPPQVNLEAEREVAGIVRDLIANGHVTAVHDVSDGGWLVTLAEMALAGGIGTILEDVNLADAFGEGQARYIVTATHDAYSALATLRCPIRHLCMTAGDTLVIGDQEIPLADLRAAHEGFFPRLMGSELTPEF